MSVPEPVKVPELLSEARTALDDPGQLGLNTEWSRLGLPKNIEHAVDCLDTVISSVHYERGYNDPRFVLTTLGQLIEAVRAELADEELLPAQLEEAIGALQEGLDRIDEAIGLLGPVDDGEDSSPRHP